MARWASLTVAICLAATTQASAASDGGVVPTMFAPVGKSLQQLIEDGYQVINIASGLTGFGYLLRRDNHYVTCAVQPDPSHAGAFRSECRAMN